MQSANPSAPGSIAWLTDLGLSDSEVRALNPCVPGEFTLPNTFYVNSGSPRIVYRGTLEGTLPLVAGRWYLIPSDIVDRHPNLRQDAVPLARAPRLIG
jgi:hypothetical protein